MADATLSLYHELLGNKSELVESEGPPNPPGRAQRVGWHEYSGRFRPRWYLLFQMGLQCSNTFEFTDQRFPGRDELHLLVP